MAELKRQLYEHCMEIVAATIANARQAIEAIRADMAGETKSSAGDKYETAREMLQQDVNQYLSMISVAQEQQSVLARIKTDLITEIIIPGSLVHTNAGSYYIAISGGKISMEGKEFRLISAVSPIGVLLMGKKPGDTLALNGKTIQIDSIL